MIFGFGKPSFKEIKQYYQEQDLQEPKKKALELCDYGISQQGYDRLDKLVNQYNDKNDSNLRYSVGRKNSTCFTRDDGVYLNFKMYSNELGKNLELPQHYIGRYSYAAVFSRYECLLDEKQSCLLEDYYSKGFEHFEKCVNSQLDRAERIETYNIECARKLAEEERLRLEQQKIIEERKQRYKDEIKRLGRIIQSRFGESEEYDSTVSILTIMEKLQNQLDKM